MQNPTLILSRIRLSTFFQLSVLFVFLIGIKIDEPAGIQTASAGINPAPCFDFVNRIQVPLKAPRQLSLEGNLERDLTQSGKLNGFKKGIWGAARGIVPLPILKTYEALLDHYTIKDPKKVQVKVYPQDRPGYQDFHIVMLKALIPLLDIHWEEEWGYLISRGSTHSPEEIVISYQKTGGTRYIPHLCGSIVLTAKSKSKTDVYLYEEVDALGRRTAKDSVAGQLGTLATLRRFR